jgi:hypothetical protein
MESNFNNREFEQYVKRNADQYRMIPSEKVWRGINNSLHTRRRWYGFGLSLLLMVTAVSVTWVMVSYPANKKHPVTSTDSNIQSIVQPQAAQKTRSHTSSSTDIRDLLSSNRFSRQEDATVASPDGANSINNNNQSDPVFVEIADNKSTEGEFLLVEAERFPVIVSAKKGNTSIIDPTTGIAQPIEVTSQQDLLGINYPGTTLLKETKSSKNSTTYYPLTIESVVNAYHKAKMNRRLTWQLYFAPTVSYRKLSVNKSYHGPASPFSAPSYPFASLKDVNSEVVHKPDMGLELGVSTKYPITRTLKLMGGIQFNINRYDIKAFSYTGEQATINLSGGNGNNSVTAWTYYRNYSGYKSDWLKNFYFSVSAPLGAELRLLGNDKTSFGIAGALQPTYILKDRAFLISSDYKNYVEMPRLVRHLNLNTSFETFISYLSRNGSTSWQIGPQVRYQALSSFQKKYPVKENLFDFGLKVGVTF